MSIRTLIFLLWVLSATLLSGQECCKYIVVDQFGYLPDSRKVAVLRNPEVGFDQDESYEVGNWYSVVNATTGEVLYRAKAKAWNSGKLDASSGDRIHHFEFSHISEAGTFYILDEDKNLRSYTFHIAHHSYNEVLKQAVRTFFYQRVGMEKMPPYAEEAWQDGASHMGDLQDPNCRSFFDKQNPDTEKDVSGGWYDAGDFNKYTNWNANYVVEFMKAYLERPEAWGDDYQIPESGNGIPDILDEARWGIDHLLRMQQADGSVLSVVGEASASPPTSATGPSYYGPPNTSSALNTASAFAIASRVYRDMGLIAYADTLLNRSLQAYAWAEMYPDSIFHSGHSIGLGAGDPEVGDPDYDLPMLKLEAACFLFRETGEERFRDFFDTHYRDAHLFEWNFAYTWEAETQDALLYYTSIEGGSPAVQENILKVYRNAVINSNENLGAYVNDRDPYIAYTKDYGWGSNRTKAVQGNMNTNLEVFGMAEGIEKTVRDAAEGIIHYIHGVNPLNFVYLSNMYAYGAESGVNEFYHSWFTDGSPLWDRVGESVYGPAPGYLTGGANPNYEWDYCCPGGCGSASNNAKCTSESISPPKDQPKQKSYKDFNTSWPLNSWQVTENSCGYQLQYIRLLSKFVTAGMDCIGEVDGGAFMDSCGVCAGGSTGIEPSLDPGDCEEPPLPSQGDTMFIEGPCLYTAAGERVVLRGVNEMFVYSGDPTGERFLPAIAQTGANCTRLMWKEEAGRKDELVELIENCIAQKMIAMPECHSATGEWDKLDVCINFWKDPILLEGIQRNKRWTLLNIGNEVGDGNVTSEQFREGYMRAIDSLRGWGYTVPLVIDGSTWGQNLQVILDNWEALQEHDPLHNILFSVHSYWSNTGTYDQVANAVVNDGVPLIIGEGPSPTAYPKCQILDYGKGLDVCGKNSIGWLSWSWGGVPNGHCVPNFDHTKDGEFGAWKTIYGEDMMATHAYSLMRTAEHPPSLYDDGLVKASGIYIESEVEEIPIGDSVPLGVMVMPVNAFSQDWSLDIQLVTGGGEVRYNPQSGYLTGVKEGTVEITASLDADPELSYTRFPEVVYVPVSSIIFKPSSVQLEVGDTMSCQVEVLPAYATDPDYALHLEEGEGVIEVEEQSGLITALAPGQARVVATWTEGEVSGSLDVEVVPPVSDTDSEEIPGLRLYPVPTDGILHIEFPVESAVNLEIRDLGGRLMLVHPHEGISQIPTEQLASGTYVLSFPWEGQDVRRLIVIL